MYIHLQLLEETCSATFAVSSIPLRSSRHAPRMSQVRQAVLEDSRNAFRRTSCTLSPRAIEIAESQSCKPSLNIVDVLVSAPPPPSATLESDDLAGYTTLVAASFLIKSVLRSCPATLIERSMFSRHFLCRSVGMPDSERLLQVHFASLTRTRSVCLASSSCGVR